MSNKFLGLDSVNVLVKYIDEQFKAHDTINKVVTIFAFRYIKDNISDSFGFSFTPFAVELFEEVIFTTRYSNYFERSMNLINQEKPDLVIYLSGERFFANY